jgi:DNA repair exonuclease SbcCD ATPase subunit
MIIKKLQFKNVKSYGNKIQEITFDDKGGITLLSGTNGAGKSTIQETIDLAVFNQVRGKETTKISLKKFPNRTNKELVVDIKFDNNNGDNIEIQRKLAPNGFNIKVNEQEFTERYKLMNPVEREHLIGFDYQTFKSFISLSMNDFLNFTHLKPENKRNLLNRLFNLEEFDEYLSITKELVNQNKREIERMVIDSANISKELKDYMELIKKNQKQNKTISTPKDELKEQISEVKKEYAKITSEIKNNDDNISDFLIKIQEQRNSINNLTNENTKRRTELTEIRNKKGIFEKGNCPYCNTDLVSHDHTMILDNLKLDDVDLSDKIIENTNKISYHKGELSLLNNQLNEVEDSKRGLRNNLIEITSNAKMLKYKLENHKEDVDDSIISDLKKKGQELLVEKRLMSEKIDEMKKETLSFPFSFRLFFHS